MEPCGENNNTEQENTNQVVNNSQLELRDPVAQRRFCWVCFEPESDDNHDDDDDDGCVDYDENGDDGGKTATTNQKEVVWISPCQCKGTMKWVHEECLQHWIDEKQRRSNSIKVTCSQCKTQYIMSFPPASCLAKLIEQYDKLLDNSSPFVAVSIVIGSIYWCCGSYGIVSIIQVMGYEEGRRLIEDSDPLLLVIGLPVIPIGLILAKLIKWEYYILRLWRQQAFKLPPPFNYFISEPPAQPRANCDLLLLDQGFKEPLTCTRMICGALLLPTISALVGKIFFSKLTASTWRRSLFGGLAFLLFKGAMRIYLKKSLYIRYSQRTIKNYTPISNKQSQQQSPNDPANPSYGEGGSGMGGSVDPRGANAGADDDDHYSRDDHRNQTDDSDDETYRGRAMFSMTIRI